MADMKHRKNRLIWDTLSPFAVATAVVISIAFGCSQTSRATPPKLPRVEPETLGMSAARLAAIDPIVTEGLNDGDMAGAVVLVGHRGGVVYQKAFGHRQVEPKKVPMTPDTLFDLASLTKPVATATSIMKLVEMNKLSLSDPVSKYIPEFAQNGKDQITIHQLLTHQGGLTPDNALRDYADGPEKSMERICALGVIAEPGSRFIYSDVGFIVLAEIVHRVSGLNVHEFTQKHFFGPLGMTDTAFLPGEQQRSRAAATEQRDDRWMCGEVHDPRAYRLGGIAGHAGLFSTAEDLAVYAQMLIGEGQYCGVRVLEPSTVATMTKAYEVPGGLRGLGWDVRTGYSSNRGDLFSSRAFGHGGFTGTAMWIDPELDLFVVFLSNRLHPDGKGSVNALAGRIGTVAVAAITDAPSPATDDCPLASAEGCVLTGIDVLQQEGFRSLEGRRIGLITNHTGVSRRGVSTAETLHRAENVELKALFSPEHGIQGALDTPIIGDAVDAQTGLKIFSLYGKSRKPSADSLKDLDTLVFDIQDIGTRFYTYISTMGNAMQAAAEHDLRFVVLDRPNSINGADVAGPVLDDGSQSFVGFHTLPVRHGMTVGELAMMFNAELNLGVDLQVIKMEGWQRRDLFDRTGLVWINPSPNMRSLTEAILYPGVGLLETTNLSVGRGTDTPFEVIGAPWLDGVGLAQELNQSRLPGVRFVPIRFTPESSKFADEVCGGVNIVVTNRSRFRPVRTGLEIARQLRRLYPDDWDTSRLNRLLGNQETLEALLAGKSVDEIEVIYESNLERFRQRRLRFLLYE
jgi:uncharacterized protein YbbC (DUF1343 family)/CubicO group peptidase (beta-lactamase class C family)